MARKKIILLLASSAEIQVVASGYKLFSGNESDIQFDYF